MMRKTIFFPVFGIFAFIYLIPLKFLESLAFIQKVYYSWIVKYFAVSNINSRKAMPKNFSCLSFPINSILSSKKILHLQIVPCNGQSIESSLYIMLNSDFRKPKDVPKNLVSHWRSICKSINITKLHLKTTTESFRGLMSLSLIIKYYMHNI